MEIILGKGSFSGLEVALLGDIDAKQVRNEVDTLVKSAHRKGFMEGLVATDSPQQDREGDKVVARCKFCKTNIYDGDRMIRMLGANHCSTDCVVSHLEEEGLADYRLATGGSPDEEETQQTLDETAS